MPARETMSQDFSVNKRDITELLRQAQPGDHAVIDRVIPLVYDELKRLAASYLRNQRPGHTFQPTALVNEAYLRLVRSVRQNWQGRAHFFSVAATIMRNILVDHARGKCAAKRGFGRARIEFKDSLDYSDQKASDVILLDDALMALAAFDERKARTLELRYFAGLNVEETAEAMGIAVATVRRDVRYAEAWLRRNLDKR
jgi:RNA polymerase sigma factor (TIGR02999 family)